MREKTNITVLELQKMTHGEVLEIAAQYPYESQFEHPQAFGHVLYRLMHEKGLQYHKTGNKLVFNQK